MSLKIIKICVVLIFILSVDNAFGLDKTERAIIKAIRTSNIAFLEKTIDKTKREVDCEFSNGKSGLYYAIHFDKTDVCQLLLNKGANPNLVVGKYSTLVWAIKHDRRRMVRLLIEFGANVNSDDKKGNTSLIYAAKYNMGKLCKILIDRGADPLKKNKKNHIASDYVSYYDTQRIKQYLELMETNLKSNEDVASMKDGPYIYWEKEDEIVFNYFERIQSENLCRLIEKTVGVGKTDFITSGIEDDKTRYHIKHQYKPESYRTETKGDIFVIGDTHGRFKALLNLLQNNKIIDSDHKWIYGDGQVVLLGDLFDRGDKVTEALWFLYELKFEAKIAGGNVHIVLGNHETMTLTGNHRYINDKYKYFTNYTLTNYFELFGNNTVLGRWLRSQNAIIQINDNLFMHAGISPQFDILNYSYDTINYALRKHLNSSLAKEKETKGDTILSAYGPLWFRGYMRLGDRLPTVPQEFIDNYLKKKEVSRMIIGHNEQSEIKSSYNSKIISVDVRINEDGTSTQGLLIRGNKIYICFSDGTKKHIE